MLLPHSYLLRTLGRLTGVAMLIVTAAIAAEPRQPTPEQSIVQDRRIIEELKTNSEIVKNLTFMCDQIGPRLTGSANLKRATEWALNKMKEYGLSNTHLEAWEMPEGWERGFVQARIIEPNTGRTLSLASYAWLPGTPGKIEADVVVFNPKNNEEMAAFKGKLKGAVVLSGPPSQMMPLEKLFGNEGGLASATVQTKNFQRGGNMESMRAMMKERNAFLQKEGVAAVFRDAGKPFGLLFTTGGMMDSRNRDRPSATERMPSFAVAHNHYEVLYRLASRPGAKTRIELEAQNKFIEGPIAVHNVIGEIRGTDKADEVVVVGAHLDSWDLGQGATDNGTGSMLVLETARALSKLGIKPRRTIRFILFTGEEQGLLGSHAYVKAHKDELPKISAAVVHDTGTGKVVGLDLKHRPVLQPILEKELVSLKPLGVTRFDGAFIGGSDHASFDRDGVPGIMFRQDTATYRLTHHSQYDTIEAIREPDLIQGAQAMSVTALHIANLDSMLPRDKPVTEPRRRGEEKKEEKKKEEKK